MSFSFQCPPLRSREKVYIFQSLHSKVFKSSDVLKTFFLQGLGTFH